MQKHLSRCTTWAASVISHWCPSVARAYGARLCASVCRFRCSYRNWFNCDTNNKHKHQMLNNYFSDFIHFTFRFGSNAFFARAISISGILWDALTIWLFMHRHSFILWACVRGNGRNSFHSLWISHGWLGERGSETPIEALQSSFIHSFISKPTFKTHCREHQAG